MDTFLVKEHGNSLRQVDGCELDESAAVRLGRSVSGGTRPSLSFTGGIVAVDVDKMPRISAPAAGVRGRRIRARSVTCTWWKDCSSAVAVPTYFADECAGHSVPPSV